MRSKHLLLLAAVGLSAVWASESTAAIRYVDANSPGPTRDGLSWTTAYLLLEQGLSAAQIGDEVWVADGTYKPNGMYSSFYVNSGRAVYGGFQGYNRPGGGETERSQRNSDPATNGCILSGDLGVIGTKTDNCYHVVNMYAYSSSAYPTVLDGFTVRDGYGSNEQSHYTGAGMRVSGDGINNINNCIIRNNEALGDFWVSGTYHYQGYSGGAHVETTGGTTTFNNCTIQENKATAWGAGINVWRGGTVIVRGCKFLNNQVNGKGAGLMHFYNYNGVVTAVDCLFSGNVAGSEGAGVHSIANVINCKFLGNSVTGSYSYGAGAYLSTANVYNSIFVGNVSAYQGGALYINQGNIINCTMTKNSATDLGGGIYSNSSNALAITNSIIWGNTDKNGTGGYSNIYRSWPYPSLTYSCVPSGTPGYTAANCITSDPKFVDADGPDQIPGNADDDVKLQSTSPCIDRGNNNAVPNDTMDLDDDTITAEPLPYDINYYPRFFDDANTPNNGLGTPPLTDLGACEFASSQVNINQHPVNRTRQVGTTATFVVSATGVGSLQYQWQVDTGSGWSNISGATSYSYTTPALTLADTGKQYRCHVSDMFGSDDSNAAVLTVYNGTRLYVKSNATGSNNGLDWTNAFTTLADALGSTAAGETWEIWVASGTYYSTSGQRSGTLLLSGPVNLYGGFAGNETALNERNPDPLTNGTILHGNNNGAISYHVLTVNASGAAPIIDGFKITGGAANGTGQDTQGGGLLALAGSPVIANCWFTSNTCTDKGAGVYAVGSGVPLTFRNCWLQNNTANSYGGGVYASTASFSHCWIINNTGSSGGGLNVSTLSARNCYFASNRANGYSGSGGAIAASGVQIINCTIIYNSTTGSSGSGGGISAYSGNVQNTIVWGNTADTGAQISGSVPVSYSCVQGGRAGTGNFSSDPLFVDSNGADNQYGTLDDDVHLQVGSPCIGMGTNTAAAVVSATTSAAGTTSTVVVPNAALFAVGDEIEYDGDSVMRTLIDVNTATNTLTFDDLLAAASVSGKSVKSYGAGDVDGEDRIINCSVDVGIDESTSFSDCDNNGIADGCDVVDSANDCNGNRVPDACETDSDGDGVIDPCDNCVNLPNADQANQDGDTYGDACESCPTDPNKSEPGICGCGIPDSGRTQITSHPTSHSECAGGTIQLSITATGYGTLGYQWYKAGVPVADGGHYSGATTSTLTITGTDANDTGSYNCVVTGGCLDATSNSATVTIITSPILTAPGTRNPYPGQSTSFSISATGGAPFTYQWRRGTTPIVDGGKFSGATTATLAITNADTSVEGNDYNCVVTGSCGQAVSSNGTLALMYATQITGQPGTVYACPGANASLSVSAMGTGTLTYQWRRGATTLANGAKYSGATSTTLQVLNLEAADLGSDYNCVVTGAGGSAISGNGSIVVNRAPVIADGDTQRLVVAESSDCSSIYNHKTFTATDPDGDSLNWSKSIATAGTVSFVGSTTGTSVEICYQPVAGSTAAASVELTVTDGCGNSDTVTISLEIAGQPDVAAWKSVKTHGTAGDVAITLDPTKTNSDIGADGPTIETRSYGLQRIVVEFDQPMVPIDGVSDANDVRIVDELGVDYPVSMAMLNQSNYGDKLTITLLEGTPDGKRFTIDIDGRYKSALSDIPLNTGGICQVRTLIGDSNNDAGVGLMDVAAIRNRNRETADSQNAQYDLNMDGQINLIDMALARKQSGQNVE